MKDSSNTLDNTRSSLRDLTRPTLPNFSIDNIVFGVENGKLMVLTAKYMGGLAEGQWGLLGGHIYEDEHIDDAAMRTLKEITGVNEIYLEQLRAFGRPERYPIKRIITIAYYALVRPELYHLIPGGTATDLQWRDAKNVDGLIYDHSELLNAALEHLRYKVRHEPIGFNLLPEKFSLLQLQEVYEAILDIKLDKPNFRRKIMKMNLLIDCGEKQIGVTHRAAKLFRFDLVVYQKLCEHGFSFEF